MRNARVVTRGLRQRLPYQRDDPFAETLNGRHLVQGDVRIATIKRLFPLGVSAINGETDIESHARWRVLAALAGAEHIMPN
jgi:hypothetical protein